MKKEHEEIFRKYIVPADNVYPLLKENEDYHFECEDKKYMVIGKKVMAVLIRDCVQWFTEEYKRDCVVLTGEHSGEKLPHEVAYYPLDARVYGRTKSSAELSLTFDNREKWSQREDQVGGIGDFATFKSLATEKEFKGIPVVSVGEVMGWVDRQNEAYKLAAETEFKTRLAKDNMDELFSGIWKE